MLGWEKVADSANTESIKGSNDYAKKRSLRQKLPRISGKEKPQRYNCVIGAVDRRPARRALSTGSSGRPDRPAGRQKGQARKWRFGPIK